MQTSMMRLRQMAQFSTTVSQAQKATPDQLLTVKRCWTAVLAAVDAWPVVAAASGPFPSRFAARLPCALQTGHPLEEAAGVRVATLYVVEVVEVENGDGGDEQRVDEWHLKEVVANVLLTADHADPPEVTGEVEHGEGDARAEVRQPDGHQAEQAQHHHHHGGRDELCHVSAL
ncbi:hypothetical protein TYRP_003448 [Tyrophagus putrescentiae]|nr:hypothetical protein TYRP_003448 [Tyrophagus putrescentiae]